MTTGTQIFEQAMALTDNLTDGLYDTDDNADYKARIVSIINSYLPELYPYNTNATVTAGRRTTPTFLEAIGGAIDLDDSLARGVLVHGVIMTLFAKDEVLAREHKEKYYTALAGLKNIPREFEEIEDVYYDSRMFNAEE